MALLSRAEILAARDRQYEDVPVAEWGGVVRVTGLTGTQRKALTETLLDQSGKTNMRKAVDLQIRLPALCMVDGDGQRLFGDEDIVALGEKSGAALKRVFETAARLSGMADDDVAEMEKNSGASRS